MVGYVITSHQWIYIQCSIPPRKGPAPNPRDPKLNQARVLGRGVLVDGGKGLHPNMPFWVAVFFYILWTFEVATVHTVAFVIRPPLQQVSTSRQATLVAFPQCFLHSWVLTGANRNPIWRMTDWARTIHAATAVLSARLNPQWKTRWVQQNEYIEGKWQKSLKK